MTMWTLLVGVIVVVAMGGGVKGDSEVMSHVTAHFGQSLDECREKSGLTKDLMEEFKHFWSEDYVVARRELGCALICMSEKFSLMHDDTRVHHMNMEDYIKSFPNGEILSKKMVQMIHECEKNFQEIEDECERVVQTAACFKAKSKAEGIAPEVAMIESVMEQYQ